MTKHKRKKKKVDSTIPIRKMIQAARHSSTGITEINTPFGVISCVRYPLLGRDKIMKTYTETEVNDMLQRAAERQERAVVDVERSFGGTLQRLKEENEKLRSMLVKRDKIGFKLDEDKEQTIDLHLTTAKQLLFKDRETSSSYKDKARRTTIFSLIRAIEIVKEHLAKGCIHE